MWGVEDAERAREIEARAGHRSVMVPGVSHNAGMAPGSGISAAEHVTPVLPVAEIARVRDGRQIIRMKGERLLVAERLPWWRFDHGPMSSGRCPNTRSRRGSYPRQGSMTVKGFLTGRIRTPDDLDADG
jgi:hypothetical protein